MRRHLRQKRKQKLNTTEVDNGRKIVRNSAKGLYGSSYYDVDADYNHYGFSDLQKKQIRKRVFKPRLMIESRHILLLLLGIALLTIIWKLSKTKEVESSYASGIQGSWYIKEPWQDSWPLL